MKRQLLAAIGSALVLCGARAADALTDGFANPPQQSKPWCYWYWISDNISREGLTRDLEAMRRVGIGEALIGNIFLNPEYGAEVKPGAVKALSPDWWGMIEHVIREGGRLGVDIGLFNCPGWSQSGGPWITPRQTMRYLASSETRVTGPLRFEGKLPAPAQPFQDVAVLAYRAPQDDADALAAKSPRVTCSPAAGDAGALADGRPDTAFSFPKGAKSLTVDVVLGSPHTVRSLQLVPSDKPFKADAELQAADDSGEFRTLRRFTCDWSNMATAVGFMPQAPVNISFPAAASKRFRILLTNIAPGAKAAGEAALAEIQLSGAARLEAFAAKQLGRMHPEPLPMWDTYMWPAPAEPDSDKLVIPADGVLDLTGKLSPAGALSWDVPPGEWVIQRTGMTPTGMKNAPASPEGSGLEVDKMNRELARRHFDAFIGELLRRMPAADRKALKRVVADSYEMGAQNWTDGFEVPFRGRYGYDPKPWLPVLTGRVVGSADRSERFLWDLRRLVADRVATEYVGGLREACQANDLGLWLENYGHWGFPSEFLKYGSESDRIGGEFWMGNELGQIELRAASSCVNTYGKNPLVSAEAFTGGPPFRNAPSDLKARGDWAFCQGINHFVLHVMIHQPWEDRKPGVNAPWGTEFNRHNTWFEQGKAWVDYVRRSSWLLQQGGRVADVAYFIGEDAPKMTGLLEPAPPPGRDFDFINAEVIEKSLAVKDGLLTLPHGVSYRVLVLPEQATMRPELLRKIRDLVSEGANVIGLPPSRSPSMENHPQCDEEVRKLAAGLWGGADTRQPGQRSCGKGRLFWRKNLDEVFTALGAPPDFQCADPLLFTHRRDGGTDIYFVANLSAQTLSTTAGFRAGDRAPELWFPDSGRIEKPAVFDAADGMVNMPLSLGPQGSAFVVFRSGETAAPQRIVSVTRNGGVLLGTVAPAAETPGDDSKGANTFSITAWIKPSADIGLPAETAKGGSGVSAARNEVIPATHGGTFGDAARHAGAGLSVGRNGVAVFEHTANRFAPVLVHAAQLKDWTHVALIYRDGQPELYLNGALARRGLRGGFIVHPGADPGNGAKDFAGKISAARQTNRALSESDLAELMKKPPDDGAALPGGGLELVRGTGGSVTGRAWMAGNFQLRAANGKTLEMKIPAVPAPLEISGPWEVSFTAGRGAPEKTAFDSLIDWTKHAEEGIRHYSGTAVYRKTFELPAGPKPARLLLDFGEVRDLATVRLNGRELATLWKAPWQVDITDAAKPGENKLEVAVTNVWNNRLVGDLDLPEDQRRTFLITPTVKKGSPLLPAGLLGPVTVRFAVEVPAKP